MKFETLSIAVGNESCDASCPYCVSKMTGKSTENGSHSMRNLGKTFRLAEINNITTLLFTGKGEPTLFMGEILKVLDYMGENNINIPFIEIQTNGNRISRCDISDETLTKLYNKGVTTIALSMAHYDSGNNSKIFGKEIDIESVIKRIRKAGIQVRLTCIMVRNLIDTLGEVCSLLDFAKENDVHQVTILPVTNSPSTKNEKISEWIEENSVSRDEVDTIMYNLKFRRTITKLYTLPHGAVIYDVNGQNLCVNNCLTLPKEDMVRQLIYYYRKGALSYDWQYKGATLLG